jgi:hypothetical protein
MTEDKHENLKMKPAPPPSDNITTTVRLVFEVMLKDKKVTPRQLTLANEVVTRMTETIQKGHFFPPNAGDITLTITIVACSEGSRYGRLCCGELGVGWVVLECEWLLMRGDVKLTTTKTEKLRDSGAIGFADLCDANYGENTLLMDLCVRMAVQIGKKSAIALGKL